MPRKTTILIAILAIITGALIFMALKSDNLPSITQEAPSPTPATTQPFAIMSLVNTTAPATTTSATQKVDVMINTEEKPIASAQVELKYDPEALSNMRIIPATTPFFGQNSSVLINLVDQEQGRISYAVGISPSDTEKRGSGILFSLAFTVNRNTATPISMVSFLEKSAVFTLESEESVLKSTIPLDIIITSPTPSQ